MRARIQAFDTDCGVAGLGRAGAGVAQRQVRKKRIGQRPDNLRNTNSDALDTPGSRTDTAPATGSWSALFWERQLASSLNPWFARTTGWHCNTVSQRRPGVALVGSLPLLGRRTSSGDGPCWQALQSQQRRLALPRRASHTLDWQRAAGARPLRRHCARAGEAADRQGQAEKGSSAAEQQSSRAAERARAVAQAKVASCELRAACCVLAVHRPRHAPVQADRG
jgi:hypothetical protein